MAGPLRRYIPKAVCPEGSPGHFHASSTGLAGSVFPRVRRAAMVPSGSRGGALHSSLVPRQSYVPGLLCGGLPSGPVQLCWFCSLTIIWAEQWSRFFGGHVEIGRHRPLSISCDVGTGSRLFNPLEGMQDGREEGCRGLMSCCKRRPLHTTRPCPSQRYMYLPPSLQ